jgi:bisphosphoglycerate-independent phosphoglycerate mutase (AlkP superfamily)
VGKTLDRAGDETAVFVVAEEGALFSSRRIDAEHPRMEDMAPTVLGLFGIAAPEWMEGKPVIRFA